MLGLSPYREKLLALLEPMFWLTAFIMPLSISGMNICLGVMTGLLTFIAASGTELPWRKAVDPAFRLLGAYFAVCLLVSLLGVAPAHSLHILPKEFHKVWVLLLLNLALALRPAPKAYLAFFAGAAVISLIGLGQVAAAMVWGVRGLDRHVLFIRAHGFVHPVTYADMLGLAAIGGICFLSRGAARLWAAFLALTGAALIFSQTRSVLLATAAAAALLSILDKRLRPWVFAVLTALLATAVLRDYWDNGGAGVRGILSGIAPWSGSQDQSGLRLRSTLWSVAWRMFLDHPWTGVGLGNYAAEFTRYFQGLLDKQAVWGSAHDLYLQQLAERGLFGFAALCALFGYMTVSAWRRARQGAGPAELWALGALAVFLLSNVTETVFENEQPATLFLCIWAWTRANASGKTRPGP